MAKGSGSSSRATRARNPSFTHSGDKAIGRQSAGGAPKVVKSGSTNMTGTSSQSMDAAKKSFKRTGKVL